jgi:CheY-like chemotaxis protein
MAKENIRIVIVDDNIDILPLYEAIGEIKNTSIIVRQSGLGALSFLHEVNYEVDAVITDLSMPDMSGIALTRHIRENEDLRSKDPRLKIFWLTGWDYDKTDCNDPIMSASVEYNVIKIYPTPYDLTAIVYEIKSLFE